MANLDAAVDPHRRDGAPELVRRALEAHGRGALDEAAALYAGALELQPSRFDALYWLGCIKFQQRRLDEARALLEAAIKANPSNALARINLANVLGAAGDFEGALDSFLQAGAIEPESVAALKGRGAALTRLGRHAEAVAAYDEALRFEPDAQLFNDRAAALLRLGRAAEALVSADAALTRRPEFIPALLNRGNALRALGRLEEALSSYKEALAIQGDNVSTLCIHGGALCELGRHSEALESFNRALELQPRNPLALTDRANVLSQLGHPAAALADLNAALAIAPGYADALNNRANLLRDLGRDQEALAGYEAAIAARPGYAEVYNNKGLVLLEIGRIEEAVQAIETSIQLAPKRVRAYFDLTRVRPIKAGEPFLLALEEMAAQSETLSVPERIELNFALSKAYADVGDHDAAFSRLEHGNALKRAGTHYDEAATLSAFARTRETFTPALIRAQSGHGHPSDAPVFIIGMPRSGTSLVEQVLASHPEVFGAGEIDLFAEAVGALASLSDERRVQLSTNGLRSLGERYVRSTTALAPDAARITNKSLDNAPFAGLIHLALPNARIIHVRRDPIDTCLSCFSKLFVARISYAYDLGELGRYHRAHQDLMAHWERVLPKQTFLQVQYEALVSDLEGEARRILAHCGLAWDPACLEFHLAQRTVRTASAAQVRRPVYQSAIGSGRLYKGRLGSLLDALQL